MLLAPPAELASSSLRVWPRPLATVGRSCVFSSSDNGRGICTGGRCVPQLDRLVYIADSRESRYTLSVRSPQRSAETVDTAHERHGVDASIRSEGRDRFGGQTGAVSVAICLCADERTDVCL